MGRTEIRILEGFDRLSGAGNMGVDEAILEGVAAGEPATLRLYEWEAATVSLGYFQRVHPEIDPGGRFHELAAVRRLSGGGAILHHHELTYSCCVPPAHPLAQAPGRLYEEMHAAISNALRDSGVATHPRGAGTEEDKAFLCFSRGDRRDLVCRGFKVVGSAQRRREGAVLQHGSILLRRSRHAPEFPGVEDLEGVAVDISTLKRAVQRYAAETLGEEIVRCGLSMAEQQRAATLAAEKYARPQAVSRIQG